MKLYSLLPSAALLVAAMAAGALNSATVASGGLIKASLPAVYYVGADGKRYVFPNDKTYFSWYNDFSSVNTVSDEELAAYTIGGNVTYKPGTRLVKIQSDPKVYAVDNGGVLRWVKTEAAAVALFGSNWSKQVDDVSDSFFTNYSLGADISSASDFNPAAAAVKAGSINVDKKITNVPVNTNTNTNSNSNTNTNTNTPVSTSSCTPACTLGNICSESTCRAVPGPSAMNVKTFVIDQLDTCFVGDPCTGGACCTIAGNAFADNANFKSVRPVDKYLYADKLQLCGRTTVSATDRNRLNSAFNDFSNAIGSTTKNAMSASVSQTRISGELALSRLPGSCGFWVSPDTLRDRLAAEIDNTTDSVFVIGSRGFDFGAVSQPDSKTVDQTLGLNGAGYTYLVKEWETDTSGAPDYSLYLSSFTEQMNMSVDLGITKQNTTYIGNHCRDGRRDFDETGVDCGGLGCRACAY